MGRLARQWEKLYREIRDDIFAYCRYLNFQPTKQQAELLELVQEGHMRIACKSGQGPGKTATSVIIGTWRPLRYRDGLTVVTAPTMRQCKEVWLREARERFEHAHPLIKQAFEITRSRITIMGRKDWGVVLATATNPESLQGFHNDSLTFIAEESSGIGRDIIETIEGTLSQPTGDMLFLQIGNPNARDSSFFDCFNRDRRHWQCLTFNCEDSERVSKEHCEYMADKYGIDSDVYRVRVLGQFPLTDPRCVMSSDLLEKCTKINMLYAARQGLSGVGNRERPAKQFGIDFARFGSDESTIYRRSGMAVVEWKRFSHVDPNDVTDYAFRMQKRAGWTDEETLYVADAGGMGQGCMKKFHDAGKNIIEFHNAGVSSSIDYDNKMTEAYFKFGENAEKGYIRIPNDVELIHQVTNRQYTTTKKGKLILEAKDIYMNRGHDSPDRADGLMMCFFEQSPMGRVIRKAG